MTVAVTWKRVLAWRMRRQFVDPLVEVDVDAIVGRLCGVQAQVASAAELAVVLRRPEPAASGIADRLTAGTLVKTWAMRGTLHLLRSDHVADHLSLLAAARTWAKPTWQRNFGATPAQIDALAEASAAVLEDAVLTREELVRALVADTRFATMEHQLRSGWGALLKPLAWMGALCFGPNRGRSVTFGTPGNLVSGWQGLPDPELAAPRVIRGYLGAYGPSSPDVFDAWLTRNSHRKTVVREWFRALGDDLVEVDVEGERLFLLAEHVDELASTVPSSAVRLLGPFDQYVLGPGTRDPHVVPAPHRAEVSRTAGWISPIVVRGGRVVGVWDEHQGRVDVRVFDDEKAPPVRALRGEVGRVEAALRRDHVVASQA